MLYCEIANVPKIPAFRKKKEELLKFFSQLGFCFAFKKYPLSLFFW